MYPTDTAMDWRRTLSKRRIEKIFKIKGRMKQKTLPLIVGSILMAGNIKWTAAGKLLQKILARAVDAYS